MRHTSNESPKPGLCIRQRGDDVKAWMTGELSDIFGLNDWTPSKLVEQRCSLNNTHRSKHNRIGLCGPYRCGESVDARSPARDRKPVLFTQARASVSVSAGVAVPRHKFHAACWQSTERLTFSLNLEPVSDGNEHGCQAQLFSVQ